MTGQQKNIDGRRWLILCLVWILYASFGLGFASLAPLVQPIQEELDISYGKMGLVLGFWQFVTIFTFYPLGKLVDRYSPRILLAIAAIAVGASIVFRGFAVDFTSLLITVGLFGFAGPIISVGAPKVISNWFIGRERNFATGVYISGPTAGVMIGMSLSTTVILPVVDSWREVLFIYGVAIMLIGIIWYLLAHDRHVQSSEVDFSNDTTPSSLVYLLKIRNVRIALALAIAKFLVMHGLINWAPSILQLHANMSLSDAGFWSGMGVGAGILGSIAVPAITFVGIRRIIVVATLVLTSIGLIGLSASNNNLSIISLILVNFTSAPIWPILTLILIDTKEIGPRRIGAAMGLAFAAAEIGGFSGPLLLGVVQQAFGSIVPGLIGISVILVLLVFPATLIKESKIINDQNL